MIDVAIIDSGLGGISLLSRLTKTFYFKNFLYFADTKNLPYGTKSKKQLLNITIKNSKTIIKKFKPKIIVFGCNTIGTTIIEDIKKIFKNQNIFAIKPVFDYTHSENNKTLLLATNTTINNIKKNNYYVKNKNNIILCKMPLLANKVENYIQNTNKIVPYLNYKLKRYNHVSKVFLGCTHYYFIKKQIHNIFPIAEIIDGGDTLIKNIKQFVCNNINLFKNIKFKKKIKVKLVLTKKSSQIKVYKNLIKQEIFN